MKKATIISATILTLSPFIAFAQPTATRTKTLKDLIVLIAYYLNIILGLMMGLAVVFFVYNVIKYFILKSDSERKEVNNYIMWSLIGFFIILSFWGLVNILTSTFNFGDNRPSTWSDFSNIFPK